MQNEWKPTQGRHAAKAGRQHDRIAGHHRAGNGPGQHRHQQAHAAEADDVEQRVDEIADDQQHIDAAPELDQAQDWKAREHKAHQVNDARGQLAQDDFRIAQVRREQELQRAPLLLLGNRACQISRGQHHDGRILHHEEGVGESLRDPREFIGIHLLPGRRIGVNESQTNKKRHDVNDS